MEGGECGQLQYEIPGCACWGSESVPIMKNNWSKQHTHIKGTIYIFHIRITKLAHTFKAITFI